MSPISEKFKKSGVYNKKQIMAFDGSVTLNDTL